MTPEQLAEMRGLAQWGRVTMAGDTVGKLVDMAERCADYDKRIGEVMPADFKDWHDNLPREWPEVAADTIKRLRERLDQVEAEAVTMPPAIHRVLVAAREVAGNTADDIDSRLRYVMVQPGRDEWRELVEALRALDGHQG